MKVLLPEVAAVGVFDYLLVLSHHNFNHRDGSLAADLLYLLQRLLSTSQRWSLAPPLRFSHKSPPLCSPRREHFLASVAAIFEAGLCGGVLGQTFIVVRREGVEKEGGLKHQL